MTVPNDKSSLLFSLVFYRWDFPISMMMMKIDLAERKKFLSFCFSFPFISNLIWFSFFFSRFNGEKNSYDCYAIKFFKWKNRERESFLFQFWNFFFLFFIQNDDDDESLNYSFVVLSYQYNFFIWISFEFFFIFLCLIFKKNSKKKNRKKNVWLHDDGIVILLFFFFSFFGCLPHHNVWLSIESFTRVSFIYFRKLDLLLR